MTNQVYKRYSNSACHFKGPIFKGQESDTLGRDIAEVLNRCVNYWYWDVRGVNFQNFKL